MSIPSMDSEQAQEMQRQTWNAVAARWRKWWPTFEHGAQHLSRRMLDLAQVETGRQVLDIATGVGEPAISAAQRVGSAGRVLATDLSPQMLALAGERAATLTLDNIEFREIDAETLDLDPERFDAILCRWALMLIPDPLMTLRKARGLLAPGGRFVCAVWDVAEKVPFIGLHSNVLNQMFATDTQEPDAKGPDTVGPENEGAETPGLEAPGAFRLADPALLRQLFGQAGFAQVHLETVTVTFTFASSDEFLAYLRDVAPGIRTTLANQPAQRQAQAWDAIAAAANAGFARADGSIQLPNQAVCIAAF